MDATHPVRCEFPVFFATTEGQTRRIADRLATRLRDTGLDSRAIDVAGSEAGQVDWTTVRGALVGASLHVTRHQKSADRFVRAHAADLNRVPSGFFSVSLSAASRNADEVVRHPHADGHQVDSQEGGCADGHEP